MRFTDTFLRQVRDRVSIADYASRKLAWDKRKTRPAAGDFWACCPFHQEKSSSFHVLDAKGIYKCFGCDAKGDVFTLAMKLEGLSFPEAVAEMAERAGMELPKDEGEDRGDAERRKRLYAAAARAAKLYADALRSREGAAARDYLKGRGFDAELCTRFGIGYAPGGYTWLIDKLRGEGFSFEELIEAGLARDSEDGRRPIDTFRDRVTFEITDAGGKIIAFGGRALQKDAKAKYINSPECALYSKSRVLYRLKQARELLAKTKASGLVVSEGYLDVIAFERAGIAAVAPCGTALTEEQLQLIWRAGGEPILCFDGDTAGLRAADRALDLALPHLGPGRTVKIALLPQGEDPDDVYRRAGPEALAPMIAAAQPASDALFERERNRRPLTTPEARAALKNQLREAVNKIADPDTRRLYFSDLLGRADAITRPPPRPPGQPWTAGVPAGGRNARRTPQPEPVTPELRVLSAVRRQRPAAESFLRAAIDYPGVLARFSDWLDRLDIADPELAAIRSAIHALTDGEDAAKTIDREGLSLHLTRSGEERAAARVAAWPKARAAGDATGVEAEWVAYVTHQVVLPALEEELAALRPLVDADDEDAVRRAFALGAERARLLAATHSVKLEEPLQDNGAADLVA
ncbi:MAG: DNA primase [Pseudomonadota bacterium]